MGRRPRGVAPAVTAGISVYYGPRGSKRLASDWTATAAEVTRDEIHDAHGAHGLPPLAVAQRERGGSEAVQPAAQEHGWCFCRQLVPATAPVVRCRQPRAIRNTKLWNIRFSRGRDRILAESFACRIRDTL